MYFWTVPAYRLQDTRFTTYRQLLITSHWTPVVHITLQQEWNILIWLSHSFRDVDGYTKWTGKDIDAWTIIAIEYATFDEQRFPMSNHEHSETQIEVRILVPTPHEDGRFLIQIPSMSYTGFADALYVTENMELATMAQIQKRNTTTKVQELPENTSITNYNAQKPSNTARHMQTNVKTQSYLLWTPYRCYMNVTSHRYKKPWKDQRKVNKWMPYIRIWKE